jgi:tyrosyl-tRNA synthetase
MTIIESLKESHLVQDISDPLEASKLSSGDKFYVGFDPTASSLQVGNLVPLIVSVKLAKAGLHPFILFGGSTGAIGDPSGRSQERSQLLDRETIDKNIAFQSKQATQIFNAVNVSPTFVNNYDWTKDVDVMTFLRDVGKHFTVNYMIAKDVVKNRLSGDGISFTEFSYMLLQAFDFLHLYKNHGVKMQIGGSDQWGNITAGLELIRKKMGENNALGFSIPLLTNSEGVKFGKSATSGTIWLDPNLTSPFKFHQFWLNSPDSDVIKYIKIFTFADTTTIQELENQTKSSPEKRLAQKFLADEVTKLVHGSEAVEAAQKSAQVLFSGNTDDCSEQELLEIFADVPSFESTNSEINEISVVDLLVKFSIAKSKGEAKRLITGGGLYLNNKRVQSDTSKCLEYLKGNIIIIRSGKKNYFLVKIY